MSKADLIAEICKEIDIPYVGIAPGSTEPKALFVGVVDRLGLPVDLSRPKPELGEAIARLAHLPWDESMDSRATSSGGGDTVTADGLRQVLRAVWLLKAAASASPTAVPDGAAGAPVGAPGSPEEEAFGLAKLGPPGGGTGLGAGGEGPVHKALKAYVKDHSEEALGERLIYLDEDLGDPSLQALGDEIKFVTGDRVDLLMRDESGRFVVIEVEPDVGTSDHIGFHQAAKYWVLVAVANGLKLEDVRRVVVARTIDRRLEEHYRLHYGIESFEVALPVGAVESMVQAARDGTVQPSRADKPPGDDRGPRTVLGRIGRGRKRYHGRSLRSVPDGTVTYRHRGLDHQAIVEGGWIRLADGRTFDNPSAAALAVNGQVPVNGWKAWAREGRSIAEIVDEGR